MAGSGRPLVYPDGWGTGTVDTFAAIDFETADNGRDSACSIGIVLVVDGRLADEHHWLIRPPRRRFLHTRIHGISWPDVAREPSFGERWPDIAAALAPAAVLVAHNVGFDRSVMRACCAAAGQPEPAQPWACTVRLARRRLGLQRARLPDVCAHLSIPLHNHHDALADARACARIALATGLP